MENMSCQQLAGSLRSPKGAKNQKEPCPFCTTETQEAQEYAFTLGGRSRPGRGKVYVKISNQIKEVVSEGTKQLDSSFLFVSRK